MKVLFDLTLYLHSWEFYPKPIILLKFCLSSNFKVYMGKETFNANYISYKMSRFPLSIYGMWSVTEFPKEWEKRSFISSIGCKERMLLFVYSLLFYKPRIFAYIMEILFNNQWRLSLSRCKSIFLNLSISTHSEVLYFPICWDMAPKDLPYHYSYTHIYYVWINEVNFATKTLQVLL